MRPETKARRAQAEATEAQLAAAKAEVEAAKLKVKQAQNARRSVARTPAEKAVDASGKRFGGNRFQKGVSGNPAGGTPGVKRTMTDFKIRLIATTGMTPIDFLTLVYRDQLYAEYDVEVVDQKRGLATYSPKVLEDGTLAPKVPVKIEQRIAAATSAAPYLHRKMPIGIDGGEGKPLAVLTADRLAQLSDEEFNRLFELFAKLGLAAPVEGGAQAPYSVDGE